MSLMQLKECYRCKEVSTNFPPDKRHPTGYSSWCRKCKNKQGRINRENRKKKLAEQLDLVCKDCGIEDSDLGFFDFHHEKDKELEIGAMLSGTRWEKILEEIKKCALLCPNCHRRRHIKERENESIK